MSTRMVSVFDNGNRTYLAKSDLINNKLNRHRDSKGRFVSTKNCPYCGKESTKEGHDACIANIPCICHACCGHGRELGYVSIKLPNGNHLGVYGFLTSIEYQDHEYNILKAMTILTQEDIERVEQALKELDLKKEFVK